MMQHRCTDSEAWYGPVEMRHAIGSGGHGVQKEDASARMTASKRMLEVVDIGGTHCIIGLNWTKEPRLPKTEPLLQEAALPYTVNHWICLDTQLGLGYRALQEKRYPSLAALLARYLSDSVQSPSFRLLKKADVHDEESGLRAGIFPVQRPDGSTLYWLFVQYGGRMVGGYSDTYADDVTECLRRLKEVQALYTGTCEELVDHSLFETGALCTEEESFAGRTHQKEQDADDQKRLDAGSLPQTPLRMPLRTLTQVRMFLAAATETTFLERVAGTYVVWPVQDQRTPFERLLLKALWGLAGLGVLGGTVFGGCLLWKELGGLQSEMEQAEEMQRKRSYFLAYPEALFARPWNATADTDALFCRCMRAMEETARFFHGWRLATVHCRLTHGEYGSDVQVSSTYQATRQARFQGLPETCRIKKDARVMEQQMDAIRLPVRAETAHTVLSSTEALRRMLLDCARAVQAKCSVTFSVQESETVRTAGVIACPWVTGRFTLEGILPVQMEDVRFRLREHAGIRITEISRVQNRFSIKGDCWAQVIGGKRPMQIPQDASGS